MAPIVYVCPLSMVGGVYADLHGGNPISEGFEMAHATLDNHGDISHQVTLSFNFETPLVPLGRIRVQAAGGRFTSGAEADHDAVTAFIETVRTQHQLFPADFNMVVISEKRALFNLMRESLTSFSSRYADLQKCVTDCRAGMVQLGKEVSDWIGLRHSSVSAFEREAVCAFHASLKLQSEALGDDIRHTYLLAQMLNHRGIVPPGLARLDATVPVDMDISWERSYYLLRTIYDVAIKKFPGEFHVIQTQNCEGGMMKATVELTCEPFIFSGEPAQNLAAAKAKLVYAVLKYVNGNLGHTIYDLHYEVRHYVDNFISLFDRRTAGIYRCAAKLKELFESNEAGIVEIAGEVSLNLSANPCTNVILHRIQAFRAKVAAINTRLNDTYTQLLNSRVDRNQLEANLAAHA